MSLNSFPNQFALSGIKLSHIKFPRLSVFKIILSYNTPPIIEDCRNPNIIKPWSEVSLNEYANLIFSYALLHSIFQITATSDGNYVVGFNYNPKNTALIKIDMDVLMYLMVKDI